MPRRRYSVDEEMRILRETSRLGITVSHVVRQHGISPSLLFYLRRRVAEGGQEAIRVDEKVGGSFEVRAVETRIRELERVLSKKTCKTRFFGKR
jgi:transposase